MVSDNTETAAKASDRVINPHFEMVVCKISAAVHHVPEHLPTEHSMSRSESTKIRERLTALLAKAESTASTAEAEALRTKAAELMSLHRLSMGDLTATDASTMVARVFSPEAFGFTKYTADHIYGLGKAARSLGVYYFWEPDGRGVRSVTMVGLESQIDMLQALMPSLKVQCDRDVLAYRPEKTWAVRTQRSDITEGELIRWVQHMKEKSPRDESAYTVRREKKDDRWVISRAASVPETSGARRRFVRSWWEGVGQQFDNANETVTDDTGSTSLVLMRDDHKAAEAHAGVEPCLLYTSPSPRDATLSRMPSSA